MRYKIVYSFDDNGFYKGTCRAWEDPKNPGRFLLPKNTTEMAPPEFTPGLNYPKFNNGTWELVPDYRGRTFYHKVTKEEKLVNNLYFDLGTEWTEDPPPHPEAVWDDEQNGWIIPFNILKRDLLTVIHKKRKQLENSGITIHTSSGDYVVDTSQIGRSNLQGTILTYEIGNLDKTSDTVPWKFENGFLELNYDQLKEISAFVTDYIENLFLAEKQHYDAIEQLTAIEEIQNYDIDQFWPSNEYNASF